MDVATSPLGIELHIQVFFPKKYCAVGFSHGALYQREMLLHHWANMKQVKKSVHVCKG